MKIYQPIRDPGHLESSPILALTNRSYLGQKPKAGAHLTVRAFPQTAARITSTLPVLPPGAATSPLSVYSNQPEAPPPWTAPPLTARGCRRQGRGVASA